jgi:hypothetical protein
MGSMSETNNPTDKNELISLADAAERYGFDHRYLATLARKGRLEARKLAGAWITTPAAVEAFIRSREQRGVYKEDIVLED